MSKVVCDLYRLISRIEPANKKIKEYLEVKELQKQAVVKIVDIKV